MAHDATPALADQIRVLKDIQEIIQLKARYCRYVDQKDWAGYGSLLMDDYHFDSDGGVYDGRDNVVAFVSAALNQATTVHHVHAPDITITGSDTASAIWPMDDYVTIPADGSQFVLRATAGTRRTTCGPARAGDCSAAWSGASVSTPRVSTRARLEATPIPRGRCGQGASRSPPRSAATSTPRSPRTARRSTPPARCGGCRRR